MTRLDKKPPAKSWVHPMIDVADSRIAGRGLFVRSPLAAGELLIRFGGRLATTADLTELFEIAEAAGSYVDTIQIDADAHLILAEDSINRFGNHSCDPTMWLDGPFELVARRPLSLGDELTVDYATFSTLPDFSLACRCSQALCRNTVTGDDWSDPSLQLRYHGHWSPAANALIRSLR